MMALARMQRFGHSPIAIVGGGTGMIGDPSGKTAERQLLTIEQIDANLAGIRSQLAKVLDFGAAANPARIVNNADWLRKLNLLEFLRDIGKHFTVNYMLAKESVKRRIEQEDGISYTEFSYLMMQSYDYLVLYDQYNCTLQMGGSDQWGNITAGADLIRRLRAGKAHGLVMPLVTTAAGVKFGKTEAGAVWLDPDLTSPFRFYQFWLNTDDRDVVTYLKYFTFLTREEVEALEAEVRTAPEKRVAQRTLARAVTAIIHGQEAVDRAEHASGLLFGERISELDVDDIVAVFDDVPSTGVAAAAVCRAGDGDCGPAGGDEDGGVEGRSDAAGEGRRRVREQPPGRRRARAVHGRPGDCGPDVRAAQGRAAVPPRADRGRAAAGGALLDEHG